MIKHWFGDETEDDSTGEDIDDEEEYSTVDRRKRNRDRKRRARQKKIKKETETATKAKHMVGIGPIFDELEQNCHYIRDYEQAKRKTVNDHLASYYKFNKKELEDLMIVETRYSAKGDGTIYIAVKNPEDITDLYIRKADCRRDTVTLKLYVPPQFYERFTSLNKLCKAKREADNNLKTQIRFNEKDLEVLTKAKGTSEPFRPVNLTDFAGDETIPGFDHSVRWRKCVDRPLRRRVTSSCSPSPAGRQILTAEPSSGQNSTSRPAIRKQLSSDSTKDPMNKKQKPDISTEESSFNEDEDEEMNTADKTL